MEFLFQYFKQIAKLGSATQNNVLNLIYNLLLDTKICPWFFSRFVNHILKAAGKLCQVLMKCDTTTRDA